MNMEEICPCVNIGCPNHGKCENCISRHLSKGALNYCGFYTVLPTLQEAIKASPDSPTAQKLASMIDNQLKAYSKLAEKHGLTESGQEQLLKKVADYSDY